LINSSKNYFLVWRRKWPKFTSFSAEKLLYFHKKWFYFTFLCLKIWKFENKTKNLFMHILKLKESWTLWLRLCVWVYFPFQQQLDLCRDWAAWETYLFMHILKLKKAELFDSVGESQSVCFPKLNPAAWSWLMWAAAWETYLFMHISRWIASISITINYPDEE